MTSHHTTNAIRNAPLARYRNSRKPRALGTVLETEARERPTKCHYLGGVVFYEGDEVRYAVLSREPIPAYPGANFGGFGDRDQLCVYDGNFNLLRREFVASEG